MSEEEDEWPSKRKQVTYEESKRVMQGQKADIDDMDDKALRTVRLTAAILAVGATGIEIIGTEEMNLLLAGFSIISLVSSAIFGVIVYNESNILVDPKASFLGKMRTQLGDNWDENLLKEMERWITNNQERVEFNGALLSICQGFLILGVLLGIAAILGGSIDDLQGHEKIAMVISALIVYGSIIGYLRLSFDLNE